jgi:hypothetical protein
MIENNNKSKLEFATQNQSPANFRFKLILLCHSRPQRDYATLNVVRLITSLSE